MSDCNQDNKRLVWQLWQDLDAADWGRVEAAAHSALLPEVEFHGHDPVNHLSGAQAFLDGFWKPLRDSFADLRRRPHIFMGGQSNGRRQMALDATPVLDGRSWVSGTGVMTGRFVKDYLGLPATGKLLSLRWGEYCRVEMGRIVAVFFMIDMIDLMQQAGLQVLPLAQGYDGLWPAPWAGDGVMLEAQAPKISAYSLDHIWRFIYQGLNRYDRNDLRSMGMAEWFTPRLHWYGPAGIGACLTFSEFENLHQRPWLVAFPDRAVQDLGALIAEGEYSGCQSWAGVMGTHTGPYLGCAATGGRVQINGMDWWKRQGEHYAENWVFVDMLHLFRQLGVDLLARAIARP